MSVVVDANLIAAQAIDFPWSGAARSRFRAWLASGTVVVAPALWQYEVTTTLRKHSSRGGFTAEQLAAILDRFYSLGVRSVAPTPELQQGAFEWATRLGVLATCDAAYLALAEELAAPFWTADRRLFNGARALGADWVHDVTAP